MDMNNIGLFRLMTEKMAWHNQRQEILARNVANADTPGYRPRDLVAFDFKRELRDQGGIDLAGTRAGHISVTRDGAGFRDDKARSWETAPAGNAVVLEEQMLMVGRNAVDYQTLLNIYRKQVGMLRTAIGRAGGGGQ